VFEASVMIKGGGAVAQRGDASSRCLIGGRHVLGDVCGVTCARSADQADTFSYAHHGQKHVDRSCAIVGELPIDDGEDKLVMDTLQTREADSDVSRHP
jgi:hypothetical protein